MNSIKLLDCTLRDGEVRKQLGTKTLRSSNFELLRILSMLMIIMHHYVGHGGFVLSSNLTLNKIIVECAIWGGRLASTFLF